MMGWYGNEGWGMMSYGLGPLVLVAILVAIIFLIARAK
jgi:hypothetical protein